MNMTNISALQRRAMARLMRQQPRGNPARRRRRMTRSNFRHAVRPSGWRAFIDSIQRLRARRPTSTVIPVHLRPWVPHVRQALGRGDQGILDQARAALPRWQFEQVYGAWL